MGVAFVQKLSGLDGTGNPDTSISTNAGSAFGSNQNVVGVVYYYTGSPASSDISSITDGTNTYTVIDYLASSADGAGTAIFTGAAAVGKTTITVNFSKSIQYPVVLAHVVSGASTNLDGHSQAVTYNPSSTNAPSPSITTTKAGDYIYAFNMSIFFSYGTPTVASPFTGETSAVSYIDAYYVQPSAGAIDATFTIGNSGTGYDYVNGIVALQAATTVASGSLSETFADFTLAGTATVPTSATLAETFADFTLAGTAIVSAQAHLAETFADFTLAGTVKVPSTAVLSETFADFILAGTALVSAQAHLAEAFADFTLAGTAIVSAQAALTETFADFTLSGTAKVPGAASLSKTFADFTLAGTALISSQAHLAEAFADFTLVGTATAPSVATLSETFTDFVLAGTALVSAQAALAEAFADFTLAGTAQGSIPSAVLSEAFGDFVLTGSALVSAQAALSETFADFTATATAAVPSTAVLSETFADFTLVGTALVSAQASLNEAFADFVLVGTAIAGGIAAGTLAETFDNFVLAGSAVSLGTVQQQPIMPPSAFHGGGAVNVSDPGFLSDPAPQLVDPIFNMAAQNVQEARDINSFPNRLKRAFAIGKAIWESTKK